MSSELVIVDEIIKLIELNINSLNVIEKLQFKIGYTNRHIRRIFKDYTKVSLYKYISYRKAVWALNDIKYSDLLMQEISLKYGYINNDSFIRMFVGIFGTSPKKAKQLNFELVFKNIVDDITAPYIIGDVLGDFKLSRQNYKDLYWNKSTNKISSYVVMINNCNEELIIDLKSNGFGEHYITNIESNQQIPNIVNKSECEITENSLVFLCYKQNDNIIEKILNELSKNTIIIDVQQPYDQIDNNYIYSISALLNNNNIKESFINKLVNIDYKKNQLAVEVINLDTLDNIKLNEDSFLLVKNNFIKSSDITSPLNYHVIVDCSIDTKYKVINFVINERN